MDRQRAGEPVTYFTGMTERDEADFIAREIGNLTAAGDPAAAPRVATRPTDIVVFYRVNAQSRVLEEALVRRRIPYYIVGGLRFYDQREIKDLIAYLRVMLNPADAVALERMIGVPPRGIGAKTVEVMGSVAERRRSLAVRGDGPDGDRIQRRPAHRQGRPAIFTAGCAI